MLFPVLHRPGRDAVLAVGGKKGLRPRSAVARIDEEAVSPEFRKRVTVFGRSCISNVFVHLRTW